MRGGYFQFFTKKSASKHKKHAILHTSRATQPTMLCRAFTGPMQAAIQALYRLPPPGPYRFGRRGYSGPVQAAYTGYVVARTV